MGKVSVRSDAGSDIMTVSVGSLKIDVDRGSESREIRSVDFLLAALGSCTLGTIGHYLRRKGLDRDVDITIEGSRGEGEEIYSTFNMTVDAGDLDEKTRTMLKGIAKGCTIHKTLHSTPTINLEVK